MFKKDTDSLDCFNGHIKCHCAHASTFPIFVLKNVSPHHHAGHTENLFQLLPAHFVVKLKKTIWIMLSLFLEHHIFKYINNRVSVNKLQSYISHKNSAANPASLETVDNLIRDVGIVHQTWRNVNHGTIWSRAHSIHVHAIHTAHSPHSSHTPHSTMSTWRASTLWFVDFPLSDYTIWVLAKNNHNIRDFFFMAKTSLLLPLPTSFTFRGRPLRLCLLTFSTAFFISSSVLNSTTLTQT